MAAICSIDIKNIPNKLNDFIILTIDWLLEHYVLRYGHLGYLYDIDCSPIV